MRSHGALFAELDRSTALATIATLSKTGPDVGGSPGWNPELLPHQSTFRGRGSHQRQHQNPSRKGSWLQKSRLPTAQGAAHGGHKNRIYRSSESGLKCRPRRILVQSHFFILRNAWVTRANFFSFLS